MITNQILQHTVEGISEITGIGLYILDSESNILAQTDENGSDYIDAATDFVSSDLTFNTTSGCCLSKIYDEGELSFVLVVADDSQDAIKTLKLTRFQLLSLQNAYRQHYDKDDFIKNLLLDNLLLVDIMNRSQKLHISMHARRVVYIVETDHERDASVMDVIRSIFSGTGRDFITAVDEKDIIIVKELSDDEGEDEMYETATALVDMLNTEIMMNAKVAYGTIVGDIKEVSRSYKEAKMALDVSSIFYHHRRVIAYSNLGIGRLIYQLPVPLCKMFITEIFGESTPEAFDEETLSTINKFFENNLNVSKTSRELYIHRNTLVYRLEKLKNITGLDIQTFEDAITFQIALMVLQYMDYLNSLN